MVKIRKYLTFKEHKLSVLDEHFAYEVVNNLYERLGVLDFWFQFGKDQWFFVPDNGVYFSVECMRQITEKLTELNDDINKESE